MTLFAYVTSYDSLFVTLVCPLSFLEEQLNVMKKYLEILEERSSLKKSGGGVFLIPSPPRKIGGKIKWE